MGRFRLFILIALLPSALLVNPATRGSSTTLMTRAETYVGIDFQAPPPWPTRTRTSTSTPTRTRTVTPTRTPTPTPTFCALATAEPLWVEPVTSPTDQLSQVITVRAGNSEAVTVTLESGTFAITGNFTTMNPALVTINLLPNTTHHLTVSARIKTVVGTGGCTYGGYSLSTTQDRYGAPLTIAQGSTITPTPTRTPTRTPTSIPGADFVGSPLSGAAPLTVQFTHLNTSLLIRCTWTFGDGTSQTFTLSGSGQASCPTTTHTYASAGSFTVTLSVTRYTGVSNSLARPNSIQVYSSGSPPPTLTPTPTITVVTNTPTRMSMPTGQVNRAANRREEAERI